MGNVSLSIAALCHAKNIPELETWLRDIIALEWERGKLDEYVGILTILKNAIGRRERRIIITDYERVRT